MEEMVPQSSMFFVADKLSEGLDTHAGHAMVQENRGRDVLHAMVLGENGFLDDTGAGILESLL